MENLVIRHFHTHTWMCIHDIYSHIQEVIKDEEIFQHMNVDDKLLLMGNEQYVQFFLVFLYIVWFSSYDTFLQFDKK